MNSNSAKLFISAALFFSHVGNAKGQSDTADQKKYYDIKSGRIVISFFDGVQDGVKTVVFDEWGNYEKMTVSTRIREGSMPNDSFTKQIPKSSNSMIIKTPEMIYSIDLDKKTGISNRHIHWTFSSSGKEEKVIGKDTLLGKPCEIVQGMGGRMKFWYWKRFCLKTQFVVDGVTLGEYATEVNEDYPIKPDEFTVGNDIKMRKTGK